MTAYLRRAQPADDTAARRARLERELERIRRLYKIDNDYLYQEYLADRHRLQHEFGALVEVPGIRGTRPRLRSWPTSHGCGEAEAIRLGRPSSR